MIYFSCVILALLMTVAALQVLSIARAYAVATGTRWQRFLSAFGHSQTILLARVASFASGIAVWVVNFLPALDPTSQIGAEIARLMPPQYSTFYALGFALLVEVVRRSPGSIDPVMPPPQLVTIPPAPAADVLN